MKKNYYSFFLLAAFLFSYSEDLQKEYYDYMQDPLKIGTDVTMNALEQVADNAIQFQATITPYTVDEILDRGFVFSTTPDFAHMEVISVRPDTTSAGINMTGSRVDEQGVTCYFKAFVLTKEGMK